MDKQKTLNAIAKGGMIAATGLVASKFISYFYRAAVARLLDPAAYGQLMLGVAVLTFANIVAQPSLNAAVQRFVPEYREKNQQSKIKGTVTSALKISLPLSILMGVLMFLSADLLANRVFNTSNPETLAQIIRVLAFVPPFGSALTIIQDTAKAFQDAYVEVASEMYFRNIVQLVVTVGLILSGWTIVGAAVGWLAGAVLGLGLAVWMLERRVGPLLISKVTSEPQYRKITDYSLPLVLAGAVGTLLGNLDSILIGTYLDDIAVGLYAAAFPTAKLISMPEVAITKLSLPSFSEVRERGDDVSSVLRTMNRWTLTFSAPGFLLLALFASPALRLLFGSEYTGAALALSILAFGNVFQSAVGPMEQVLKSYDDTPLLAKNSFIQLFLNLCLNILLIPSIGIVGAAVATAGTSIAMKSILFAEGYRKHSVVPFNLQVVKPLIASAISLIPVYVSLNLIFEATPIWATIPGVIIYFLMYFPAMRAMKGFREEDRPIIVGAFRQVNKESLGEKVANLFIGRS